MTVKRQVLRVDGHHRPGSPVPEVIVAGDLLFTSLCGPTNTNRQTKPGSEGPDVDAEYLFQHVIRNVEAAGGSAEDIVDFAIYINQDDSDGVASAAINKRWLATYPDEKKRPACRVLNIFPEGTHWPMAAAVFAVIPGQNPSGASEGRLVYSPTFTGRDDKTGKIARNPVAQAAAMFDKIESWVRSQGGTPDNIINVMANLHADSFRKPIDEPWARLFPDINNLPARQTYIRPQALRAGELFSAVATAVI